MRLIFVPVLTESVLGKYCMVGFTECYHATDGSYETRQF